jgi:hypothetical protein
VVEVIAERAIYALLTGNAALTDVVGVRIWPGDLPLQGGFPAVSFFEADAEFWHGHDGPAGLAKPRIQVDCWAKADSVAGMSAYEASAYIASLVNDVLDGFRGAAGGVEVQSITRVLRRKSREPDQLLRRVTTDYVVAHHTDALI